MPDEAPVITIVLAAEYGEVMGLILATAVTSVRDILP
jgi:hypothetical protein